MLLFVAVTLDEKRRRRQGWVTAGAMSVCVWVCACVGGSDCWREEEDASKGSGL